MTDFGEGSLECKYDPDLFDELPGDETVSLYLYGSDCFTFHYLPRVRMSKPKVVGEPSSEWQWFKLIMLPRWFRWLFPVRWVWTVTYNFVCEGSDGEDARDAENC